MKQMQNLATKISNAIKETNGRLPKSSYKNRTKKACFQSIASEPNLVCHI